VIEKRWERRLYDGYMIRRAVSSLPRVMRWGVSDIGDKIGDCPVFFKNLKFEFIPPSVSDMAQRGKLSTRGQGHGLVLAVAQERTTVTFCLSGYSMCGGQ
jgi:hypothetical protein